MSTIILKNGSVLCYDTAVTITNGIFQDENPTVDYVPYIVAQLVFIHFSIRILYFILKPLHQPRIVAEILTSLLVGPWALGKEEIFDRVFPLRSILSVETFAYMGLLFHVFLAGLEIDLSSVYNYGKKPATIAIAGAFLPLTVGVSLFFFLQHHSAETRNSDPMGCIYWAVALTLTSYPDVADILTEIKLLYTDLGRTALSSAMISSIFTWFLLAISFPFSINYRRAAFALIFTSGFVVFSFSVVHRFLKKIINLTTERGYSFNDYHVCVVLAGILIFAFITDVLGTHCVIGAFIFGLIMPNGELRNVLLERVDFAISSFFLPLYFALGGIRINSGELTRVTSWVWITLVIILAYSAKIVSTLLVTSFFKVPTKEALALGLLMNTKGILAIIILNIGWDKKVLSDQLYSIMTIAILSMTFVVAPTLAAIYRPKKNAMKYKRRTIHTAESDSELRVFVCIHSTSEVTGMVNLLEFSNPTKQSPLYVFALHLIELTGRASAMLVKSHVSSNDKYRHHSQAHGQANQVADAFEQFENQNFPVVSVEPLTTLSPYNTMDEDIYNLAEVKRAAFIILPFHKHLSSTGDMEENNPAIRGINLNVLANAPCTVGIFIDRGLGSSAVESSGETTHNANHNHHFAMLFIGGPDDREALAYAWRMAEHPGVTLSVVRFLPGTDAEDGMDIHEDGIEIFSILADNHKQKILDNEYVNEFRRKAISNSTVSYTEMVVNNGEETVNAISSMNFNYDLFIVGKGQGVMYPMTSGLSDWVEFQELGTIGDVLVSSCFATHASVLVMQQYGSGSIGVTKILQSKEGSKHGSKRKRQVL